MCRSTLFPWFLVRWLPALVFLVGLIPVPASAEDPVEARLIETQNAGRDPAQSAQSIEELRQLGRQAIDAADGLLAFITDPDAPLELRNRAVQALRDAGLPDADRARVLYAVLADPQTDMDLRRTILLAHGDRREFGAVLVPALLQVLIDPAHGLMLRRQVVFNLAAHLPAEGVVEQLTRIVGDANEPAELRSSALDLLRGAAEPPPDTIQALRILAIDQAEPAGLRLAAIDALGRLGATDAVAADLVEILFQQAAPAELQLAVAAFLIARDRPVPVEFRRWISLLETGGHPVEVRRLAARSLARSSPPAPESIELSIQLLGDEEEDTSVRLAAAEHLRADGAAAEQAMETVELLLHDARHPVELREVASDLWVQVARDWLGAPEDSTWELINTRLTAIDQATALLDPIAVNSVRARQNLAELRQIQAVLVAQQQARWRDRARDWMQRHPRMTWTGTWVGTLVLLALGLAGTWWVLARRAPMRVWELDRRMSRWDWQAPTWLGGGRIGPRHLLLLARRANSLPVLDAWLRAARPYVRLHFEQLRAEYGVAPYVPLPARWNGRPCAEPPWDSIRQRLTVSGGGILVGGEAGTGKSGCALECAWRMLDDAASDTGQATPLPVWIGQPQSARDGVVDLAVEVRSALALLLPAGLLPGRGTILKLLGGGRLLPFLDAVSEWPAAVIPSVHVALERFNRHQGSFLLITRLPEVWATQAVTRLELSPLAGGAAIGFLQSYLTRKHPEVLTSEGQLVALCQHWAALADEQTMPVQIVRIFGDVAVRRPDAPPENLVAVARHYVEALHRDAGPGSFDEAHVVRVACRLAWAELGRPETSVGLTVSERLSALGGGVDAAETVDYLERRLGLLERWQPGDRIRFRQQPLAAVLAALHLIEENHGNDEGWHQFLRLAHPTPGSALAMVLHALWDAGLLPSDPPTASPIPEWVGNELARRLGIHAANRQARRDATRARDLVRQIVTPENPERSSALEELAAMGPSAASTLPALESVFRDQTQDLDVRFGALTALGLLGAVALPARGTLEAAVRDRREQLFIRLKALEFLAAMGQEHSATLTTLIDRLADPTEAELLRLRAGNILSALPGDQETLRSALDRLDVSGFPPAVRELARKLSGERATSTTDKP